MSDSFQDTEIGKIPVDWKIVSLEEIKIEGSSITYGVVKPGAEISNGILFIRGGDIKNGKINKNLRTISKEISDQYKRTLLEGGELLISLVGYPGECAVVPKSLSGANIARQVGLINIKSINSVDFVKFYLSSVIGKKYLLGNLVGSAQQVINLDMLRKVKIPLPPLPEQQKIAEILSTVDEKIEVIEEQINQTTALKKGLMQQLLTKGIGHIKFKDSPLGKIPESWEAVKLGELSEKVGSGITPKGGHEAYVERGVVFIRSQNVLRGKLDLSDVVFISEDQHIKMSNSWLRPNDVLLNITGASIGRSCIVPDDMSKGNVNQHVCIIRPNEKIIASYLSQLLNSKYGIDQIDKFQAGGNREGLNYQQIRSFVIPLPPKNEQLKIAGIVGTIDKKLESLELKRNYFNEFKKGLMQQLLTGKLRVNLNPTNHAAKSGELQTAE